MRFSSMRLIDIAGFLTGISLIVAAHASPCGDVASHVGPYSPLKVQDTSSIPPWSFSDSASDGTLIRNNVSFCRVSGQVGYGLKNSVGFELWLPSLEDWNGRYMAVGNGGLAGYIQYSDMLLQLNSGFAVASGDGGHLKRLNGGQVPGMGQRVPFLNDLEQTTAWIHNSIADITPSTRDLATAFYGRKPLYSYFYGCSTGGGQGFALAQFYPDLFDGIYAGSPGNWYSHLILSFLWNFIHSQGLGLIDQNTLNFITNATLEACDGLDGAKDGLIENPLRCSFDISSLRCEDGLNLLNLTGRCLTDAQIRTYHAFFAGPVEPDTGVQVYPGFQYGSESSWLVQETSLALQYTGPILQNLVFKNLTYDVKHFTFDKMSLTKVNESASPFIDEMSPDLTAFKSRGGKLITTQGWADPFNAPTVPIDHLSQIDAFLRERGAGTADDFHKVFMVPGGGHCGPNSQYPHVPGRYHVVEALQTWVENGKEPVQILSTKAPDRSNTTRKLCAWPRTAKFITGDPLDWVSYECVDES